MYRASITKTSHLMHFKEITLYPENHSEPVSEVYSYVYRITMMYIQ